MYKYGDNSTKLISSYLSHRSQFVMVNGQMSDILWMKYGVPQGSNLGPFLFNLYTQELGAVVSENCSHNCVQNHNGDLFDQDCDMCGILITFADDATIILKTRRDEWKETSDKLDTLFSRFKLFLRSNSLQLNINKTQLLRVTLRQQLVSNKGEKVLLEVVDKDNNKIAPKPLAKILGLTVNNNLIWSSHLEKGKDSIIPKCKKNDRSLKVCGRRLCLTYKEKACRSSYYV